MFNKVAADLVEDPDKDWSEARCDAIKARPDFKEEVTFNKKCVQDLPMLANQPGLMPENRRLRS